MQETLVQFVSGTFSGEGISYPPQYSWASLVAQQGRICLGMQETQVPSLGQEDPLEKEMKTHSSILAWEIPWTEEPGKLQTCGCKESDTTEAT